MSTLARNAFRACFLTILAAVCCLPAAASDPPDSELNPVSGKIETVDSSDDAGNYDLRFVADPGGGCARSIFPLTTDALDDLAPRLTITAEGDTWVVWWRDGEIDSVLARKRTLATDSWSEEITVGDKLESGSRPEIVHDGSAAWVAYEIDGPALETTIAVGVIHDDPDPVTTRETVDTTGYTGDRDLSIVFADGHLWVSWVDSATEVAWSEYDYATESWGAVGYESYASDDVEQARERITTAILAN